MADSTAQLEDTITALKAALEQAAARMEELLRAAYDPCPTSDECDQIEADITRYRAMAASDWQVELAEFLSCTCFRPYDFH